jgi:hypothetical protein
MKGQAEIVEHVLTVLLGVILMIIVTAIVYNFYTSSLKNDITESLRQIDLQVSENMVKMYGSSHESDYAPPNGTSYKLNEVNLGLPTDISKRNYEVRLVSSAQWNISNFTSPNHFAFLENASSPKVIARTTQDPVIEVSLSVPDMDVVLQGRAANGKSPLLSYNRYNINGTVFDSIVLGSFDSLSSLASSS